MALILAPLVQSRLFHPSREDSAYAMQRQVSMLLVLQSQQQPTQSLLLVKRYRPSHKHGL